MRFDVSKFVPEVSVVLPVHNGMQYLPEALNSLLRQTCSAFEVNVIDDGSTDDTPQFVQAVEDDRVRYHRLEKVGLSEALNFGLSVCTSSIVARMDADDVAETCRLEKQLHFLKDSLDCVVLGCQSTEIDASGKERGERRFPESDAAIRWQLGFGCPFLHPGVMYRRDAVLASGGYLNADLPSEDYGLWVRLASHGRLANHPEKLLRYRVHANSVTSTQTQQQIDVCRSFATSFVSSQLLEIDRKVFEELYDFLSSGCTPERARVRDLASAYCQWRKFCLKNCDNDDLSYWITDVSRRLRWHCLEHAQRSLPNLVAYWNWIKLAGAFDPENGSLRSMATRQFRKLWR